MFTGMLPKIPATLLMYCEIQKFEMRAGHSRGAFWRKYGIMGQLTSIFLNFTQVARVSGSSSESSAGCIV